MDIGSDVTGSRRVFVVAGSPTATPPALLRPSAGDFVIAADSGIGHALAWGWRVDLAIGDMDSVAAQDLDQVERRGTRVVRMPPAKDETDLELALLYAVDLAPREIVVCGALGGRSDHYLANVLLLARRDLRGHRICLQDGGQAIVLLLGGIASQLQVEGEVGDLLSLLPVGGDVRGVSTAGLSYPLVGETLYMGAARGMSNVFVQNVVTISAADGMLLVIHTSAAAGSSARPGGKNENF